MTRVLWVLGLMLLSQLCQAASVRIAAVERQPYSSVQLPENGMVNELIMHSYATMGIRPKVTFYPLARAMRMLENGEVDVVVPVLSSGDPRFIYSTPIPGSATVILKYRHTRIDSRNWQIAPQNPAQLSLLRGSEVALPRQYRTSKPPILVSEEFQQLGLLQKRRVDAVIMDKHTAADLMVNYLPSLIGQLDYQPLPEAPGALHLAFNPTSRNSLHAKAQFEHGMSVLKENGKLPQILKKYGFYPDRLPSDEQIELVIGAVDINMVNALMALTERYQRIHPNVKIQWRVMDETRLRKRLLGDIAINDGQFDVVMVGDYEAMVWGKQGWLMPLNEELAADVRANLLPIATRRLGNGKGLYALPLQSETSVTVYRKDIFDSLGLTMPLQPSYEDLLELATLVKEQVPGVYGLGFRGKPG